MAAPVNGLGDAAVTSLGDFGDRLYHKGLPDLAKSAGDMAHGLAHAVRHPQQTADTIGTSIGQGAQGLQAAIDTAVKNRRYRAAPQATAAKAAAAGAAANQGWVDATAPYRTPDANGAGNFSLPATAASLADHTGRVAQDVMTAAPVVGGAARGVEGLVDAGSFAAKAAGNVAKGAHYAGTWANPIVGGAVSAPGVALKLAKPILGVGVPKGIKASMGRVYDNARTTPLGSPASKQYTQDFNAARSGQTPNSTISQKVNNGIQAVRKQSLAQTAASKASLQAPVDVSPTSPFATNAESIAQNATNGSPMTHSSVHQATQDIRNAVLDLQTNPDPNVRTVLGLDKLKDHTWDQVEAAQTPGARNAYMDFYTHLNNTISAQAPEYADIMAASQQAKQEAANIQNTIGPGKTKSANAAVAKALKAIPTSDGSNMLDKLNAVDPSIEPSLMEVRLATLNLKEDFCLLLTLLGQPLGLGWPALRTIQSRLPPPFLA